MSAYVIMKEHDPNSWNPVMASRDKVTKPHGVFFGSAKEMRALVAKLNMRSRQFTYYGVRSRRITVNGNLI